MQFIHVKTTKLHIDSKYQKWIIDVPCMLNYQHTRCICWEDGVFLCSKLNHVSRTNAVVRGYCCLSLNWPALLLQWRRYINPFSFSFTVYENFAKHELGQICLCFGELQSWLWNCLLLKLRSGSSNDGRCVSIVQTLLHDIVMECRYSWGRETFTQLTGHCKSITVVLTHSLQWRWYDLRTVKCPRLFV